MKSKTKVFFLTFLNYTGKMSLRDLQVFFIIKNRSALNIRLSGCCVPSEHLLRWLEFKREQNMRSVTNCNFTT